jgi:hypothetical protein
MGAYCRKCKKCTIPVMAALANLTGDGVRCDNCGTHYSIAGVFKLLYLTLEGAAILLSVYISFYFLTAIPLVVGIVLMFLARLLFLPLVAKSTIKKRISR